jgi:hypothetical protein
MKRLIQLIAAICLVLSLAACLVCSRVAAQPREQGSPDQQKLSPDRPAEAEFVFGKDGRYSAALLCCWRILVYEQQGNRRVMIWDWDKFDGGEGFKNDFLVRDVDGDENEEVAFQIGKMNFCFLENAAALYSPEKRIVFLLKYDGDIGLHLSPNLKDNHKVREWLIKYWQERYRADLNKITVTYDAEP